MARGEPKLLRMHGDTMDTYLVAEAHFRSNDGVIDPTEESILTYLRRMMRSLEGLNLARKISNAIADHGIDLDDPRQVAAIEAFGRPQNIREIREYRRDLGDEPRDAA